MKLIGKIDWPAIERYLGLGGILFYLIKSSCSESIGTYKACLPVFLLVIIRHLWNGKTNLYRIKSIEKYYIAVSKLCSIFTKASAWHSISTKTKNVWKNWWFDDWLMLIFRRIVRRIFLLEKKLMTMASLWRFFGMLFEAHQTSQAKFYI